MDDGRHHCLVRRTIASQPVRHKPPARATLTLQQLTKEAFGSTSVATRLDEDIDHITILINGTPEILTPTLDGDEHLVQVPRIAEATLSALQRTRVLRAELEAPKPDRFVGNCDAALREEILNISKAQTETVVQPDGVVDDFWRKSISAVARRVASH
jgi:hypothetical protein